MRTSETWVCLADGDHAQFYHCDAPSYCLEPVMGFGVPRGGRTFAGRLASQLDRAARDSLFVSLVLVGPPAVLAEVEGEMAPDTRNRVVGEVSRNLCGRSPRELETHLCGMLRH
ncbi:MAG TPA: host attachment protein [Magnetospirillum sp.]|nr:host attachment protein [Magnetospirillum sp.]